jgi:hypothetical protein
MDLGNKYRIFGRQEMSPDDIKLLVHIDAELGSVPNECTRPVIARILDLVNRGLIEPKNGVGMGWKATKLGRAVCTKFYGVDESDIKFCGECGRVIE